MKHVGGVLLALSLSGCVLLLGGKNEDGGHCDAASDCESDNCMGNVCVGSECSSESDCPDNFRCYHYEGDPIFGIGAGRSCRLACDAQGACPSQWTCYSGDTYYSYVGPKVTVAVSNKRPQAREVVTFTATIDPPLSGVTWKWDFYSLGQKTGSSVEMSFEPGSWDWSVECATAGDACVAYAPNCCDQLTCNASTLVCE